MSVDERDPVSTGQGGPPVGAEERGGPPQVDLPRTGEGRAGSGFPPLGYPILALLFAGALVWAFSRILLAIADHTIKIGGLHIEGKAAISWHGFDHRRDYSLASNYPAVAQAVMGT